MSVGVSRGVLARSIAEVPLDHSVLERVEGDDGQPAARGEKLERGIKYALELSKLIVDGHAECLECPGGRMCAALAVSRRFGDAVSESERAGPRAAFKDCPCDSSGSWLFAEASKDGDDTVSSYRAISSSLESVRAVSSSNFCIRVVACGPSAPPRPPLAGESSRAQIGTSWMMPSW